MSLGHLLKTNKTTMPNTNPKNQKLQNKEKDFIRSVFHQAGCLALDSLHSDQIISALVEQLVDDHLFRSLVIALVDHDAHQVKLVRSRHIRNTGAYIDETTNLVYDLNDNDIFSETARTGKISIVEGWDKKRYTNHDNRSPEELERVYKNKVAYFIPVKAKDKVIAILATASTRELKKEMQQRIDTMKPLLDQIAIAFSHARLFESESEQKQAFIETERLLAAYHTIGQILLTSQDEAQILSRLVTLIIDAGLFRSLAVALVDKEENCIRIIESKRIVNDHIVDTNDKITVSLDSPDIMADVVRTGKFEIIEGWDSKRYSNAKNIPLEKLKEEHEKKIAYFMPIKHNNNVIAVLATGSTRNDRIDTEHRIKVMWPLLDQVAVAIEHARLKKDLEKRVEERTTDLQVANQRLQEEIATRQNAEEALSKNNKLLDGLRRAQSKFIEKVDTRALFEELLQILLDLTDSEYGFIGEILHPSNKPSYLHTYAITQNSWNEQTQSYYNDYLENGLEFFSLKSLFNQVITTQKPIIENNFEDTHHLDKAPPGHPPLDSFLGLPFFNADKIVGMIGLANKIGGYNQSIIDFLAPLLVTCGTVIGAQRAEKQRQETQEALQESEEKLLQSQKMEALGQLAGGIAHDFNNLLTVINGYSKILIEDLSKDDPNRDFVEEIKTAGSRASDLTNQLLALSRRQVMQPQTLDLNKVTAEFHKILQRLLSENIDLKVVFESDTAWTEADPGQLEQVLLNLSVNAKDAMPEGGILSINISKANLIENQTQLLDNIQPGPYVLFSITDTGSGIDAETRKKIFDPFFTTKEKGKGTGLGLSTVYGIVKQSGGHIEVESEKGEGATFKIYFPEVSPPTESQLPPTHQTLTEKGNETILVVEDEDLVRKWISRILTKQGYTVMTASNGEEAFSLWQDTPPNTIDLLLTDVIMPKMSGKKLADLIHEKDPNFKVLYMSGYTDGELDHHGVLHQGIQLVQKPFETHILIEKVRDILDGTFA